MIKEVKCPLVKESGAFHQLEVTVSSFLGAFIHNIIVSMSVVLVLFGCNALHMWAYLMSSGDNQGEKAIPSFSTVENEPCLIFVSVSLSLVNQLQYLDPVKLYETPFVVQYQ